MDEQGKEIYLADDSSSDSMFKHIDDLCAKKERKVIDAPISDWNSGLIEYDDSWYMDKDTIDGISGGAVDMIYGPYIELPRGSYTVTVEYATDTDDNVCLFKADKDKDNSASLRSSSILLDSETNAEIFHIEVLEDIDNFGVTVQYNRNGYLRIHNITISENKVRDVRNIAILFFLFAALDLLIIAYIPIKEHRREALWIVGIIFLACMPEMIRYFYHGHDLSFHLLRIEGIAEELRLGNFPARMHSISLAGYGYPVSIFYGDVLLYIPALMRLAGFSVLTAYKVYIFMINAATTVISYGCFEKMFQDTKVAMIGALVYVTGAYRLVDIYERAAVGEYTAMMALPLIALAVYQIYTMDSYGNWKEYKKNALLLAVGMSLMITSHVLSTEIVVLFLAGICIIMFRKTFRKNTLKVYVAAVWETLLICAFYLVPFCDYYMNLDVNITNHVENNVMKIQENGAYISQYFTFFARTRSRSMPNVFARMQLTPGLVPMTALVIAIYLLLSGKKNKRCLMYTSGAVAALFLGSNLFPWNSLSAHSGFFNMLSQVQFPWRYLAIAAVFLTLLVCELLVWLNREKRGEVQKVSVLIVMASVLMTCYNTGNLLDEVFLLNTYDTASIENKSVGAGEYVRTGTDITALDGKYQQENMERMDVHSRKGSAIELYCETGDKKGWVEVPMLNYKGYHVVDEFGKEYEITDGANNVIHFEVPEHFKGQIRVYFKEPAVWRIAEVVSLCYICGLAVWKLLVYRRKKKQCVEKAEEKSYGKAW